MCCWNGPAALTKVMAAALWLDPAADKWSHHAMFNTFSYLALLVACCVFAFLRGGAPEKIGAAIIAAGSILTFAVMPTSAASYHFVRLDAFVIDVACLVAFTILALRAERYWPLWVAALQIIGIAGHAIKFADPDVIRRAFAFALAFWSYPMLLLIALGTHNHQRRLRRNGSDPSWSSSFGRSPPTPPGAPTP